VTPLRRREEYLARERDILAPYASRAADTRGRAFQEPEHPLRSPYERDRDRIIHSGAFRKLEYKTQVFVNHEGDYYRTRLTHTLEAAQIARSAARFLRLNEDLTEAIALVHDVGHPPFGHAGEAALRECMSAHGGFEHNLHSLRVVDTLERHYPHFVGLNLTWEVREGIIKHSKAFDPSSPAPGLEEFAGALWPSLEAQIVDVCDEIAYNAHDIDDGLAAGMISLEALNGVELWRRLCPQQDKISEEYTRYQGVGALINTQVGDLVETVAQHVSALGVKSADDVRSAASPIASLSVEMTPLNAELRRFLHQHVYRHFRVYRMWIKAKRIVTELFRSLEAEPGQFPPGVWDTAGSGWQADPLSFPRAVCDYIAALSDREALNEHARLFDPFVPP
jgi:dGTPase